ncbi:hypothetical protein RF11_15227 [Thelohanellus kitauei]|uniref:Uncharacterized protein n=1 Tax=Thelohanellus kitauei TaxID=669202 RepID=A0A0C2J300_THEKT|nr:hypothetical protein RF11_15227 [Thelohanellus kitauei]
MLMLSFLLLSTYLPRFIGYKASIYDIEACYEIIQPGETILVGFRFPAFNSVYPPTMYMIIKLKSWQLRFTNKSTEIFEFALVFHSKKCNKTMDISLFGADMLHRSFTIYLGADISAPYLARYDFILLQNLKNEIHVINDNFRFADLTIRSKYIGQCLIHSQFNGLMAHPEIEDPFHLSISGLEYTRDQNKYECLFLTVITFLNQYLSRAFLIKYETLHSFNISRSQTVAVEIFVYSQHNHSYGNVLLRLDLQGWRINVPENIPRSMLIENVMYDPSWNEILIKIAILDVFEDTKEISVIRIENGIQTIEQESDVVFANLNFREFEHRDYILYTNELKIRASNILPLVQLRMVHYRCEIGDMDMTFTEFSFQSKVIDRCMRGLSGNEYYSGIRLWENMEHSYTSLCKQRYYRNDSDIWNAQDIPFI